MTRRFLLGPKTLAVAHVPDGPISEAQQQWADRYGAILVIPAEDMLNDRDRKQAVKAIAESSRAVVESQAVEAAHEKGFAEGRARGEREGYKAAERELKPKIAKVERERDAARVVGNQLRTSARAKPAAKPETTTAKKLREERNQARRERDGYKAELDAIKLKTAVLNDVASLCGEGTKENPWNQEQLEALAEIAREILE